MDGPVAPARKDRVMPLPHGGNGERFRATGCVRFQRVCLDARTVQNGLDVLDIGGAMRGVLT